eukprot:GEZU01006315.1.p1 GENE.GEZU01006315.1~~GEZU01006315.1.p1  ORF type:complete len:209 (-),score=70.11 GEZU01006315.1:108-695(-)
MAVFSVSDQFVNYGEYHRNPVNKLIHFIFVPLIVFSLLIFVAGVPIPVPAAVEAAIPKEYSTLLAPNLGLVFLMILIPYYLILDFATGMLLLIENALFYLGANYIYHTYGPSQAYTIAAITQVVSWGTQFLGHGVWEGRRPALVDNGLQIFIAPLFVMLEALFFLGFKQDLKKTIEKKLHERVNGSNNNKKKKAH